MAEAFKHIIVGRRRLMLAGLVLALSNFMVVLDLTVANVSIPHISGNLAISPDQGTWIITSYAVAEAICVPLTGWLAQRFGTVRVFVLSMIGFGIFSTLCGLSPTLGTLVAARIGQGLCGGPIMPLSQTLLQRIFPPESRGKAMGMWAMTMLLGPVCGPIVGGAISDNWSWHWIFFINIPVAMICTFSALALLRPAETKTAKLPIDLVGLGLLIFWIGCLQIMLDIGRDHDWFGDPKIVMLAIGAAIGFVAFVIWELTDEHPIVDIRIFRHRGFTFSVLTLALCFGAYFASIVVIPQWLQASMGYTAFQAGYTSALSGMTAIVASPFVAKMMGKVDPRIMISGGVAWLGLASILRLTHWSSGSDWWTIAIPQILQGFGMPFFMMPVTAVSLAAVKPNEIASAAGLQNFTRTLSIAVATSLVLTIWGDNQRVARSELASKINPDTVNSQLTNAGMSIEQVRFYISSLVEQESVALAVNHVFAITAVLLFCTAAFVWFAPKPKGPVDTSAAH